MHQGAPSVDGDHHQVCAQVTVQAEQRNCLTFRRPPETQTGYAVDRQIRMRDPWQGGAGDRLARVRTFRAEGLGGAASRGGRRRGGMRAPAARRGGARRGRTVSQRYTVAEASHLPGRGAQDGFGQRCHHAVHCTGLPSEKKVKIISPEIRHFMPTDDRLVTALRAKGDAWGRHRWA